ncbi:MAG: hypothetical protein ABUL73_02400 [Alphaproteobacteria bacterium]
MADDATITIKLDSRTAERLSAHAREEGVSPEEYAAEVVSEIVDLKFDEPPPGFLKSGEDLRAAMTEQLRRVESGEAETFSHEEVMAEARAIIEAARKR